LRRKTYVRIARGTRFQPEGDPRSIRSDRGRCKQLLAQDRRHRRARSRSASSRPHSVQNRRTWTNAPALQVSCSR
jgi:hypothetical protein